MSAENPSADVGEFLLVFVTVLHSLAVVMTCLRLWLRVHLHRLWWEDAWAALALCLDILCAVSTWTQTLPLRDHPWYMSQEAHIASTWLLLVSYTCLIWAARMSIMFSLIRMVPPSDCMRNITHGFGVLFFFLWALCTISKVYTCGSDRSWYSQSDDFRCSVGLPIAIIEFTTDVVSDVILVALPARILWRMKLPRNERILILSIFSMSLLSVMMSIIHVAFLIPAPGFIAGVTANIEGAMDLMVCNFLVLVTSLYRILRKGDDIDIEYTENTRGWTTKPPVSLPTAIDTLTTVDLEHFETISIQTRSTPLPCSATESMCGRASSCFSVSIEQAPECGTVVQTLDGGCRLI